jgi:hypothetical protein
VSKSRYLILKKTSGKTENMLDNSYSLDLTTKGWKVPAPSGTLSKERNHNPDHVMHIFSGLRQEAARMTAEHKYCNLYEG